MTKPSPSRLNPQRYIIQNSPKAFINYRIFKEQIETENYLHTLDDNFFMQNEIGDECHYILECKFANSIPKNYIGTYLITNVCRNEMT
jgi:hypothetical protein